MYRTESQKQDYIKKLFADIELFEWEVLHISTNDDRVEVMQILAKTLVRDVLKNEISFLFIDNYTSFKISSIKSALFQEIAKEWIYFATEILYYNREKALQEIQDKDRASFIYEIVNIYYKNYREYIFEEIADTFIELVGSLKINPNIKNAKMLVDKVLQSDLVSDGDNLAVHTSNQLQSQILNANSEKKDKILKMQERVSEITKKLKSKNLDSKDYVNLHNLLEKYKLNIDNFSKKELGEFDISIKRLKETFVKTMLKKTE